MARGKHRTATPVRLVAVVAAALAVGGLLVHASTASADNQSASTSGVAQAQGGGNGGGGSGGGNGGGNGGGDNGGGRGGGGDSGGRDSGGRGDGGGDSGGRGGGGDSGGRDGGGDRGGRGDGGGEGRGNGGNNNGGGDNGGDNNAAGNDNAGNDNAGGAEEQAAEEQAAEDQAAQEDEQFPGRDQAAPPSADDFIDIQQVAPNVNEPQAGQNASTGTFTSVCGTNEEGHRNSDNFMVTPGVRNGAQHVHDYVGNLSTDAFSDEESLDAAGTTCARGDKSPYFWPVLRNTAAQGDDANEDGGGLDGNFGQILNAKAVDLQFRGNPTSEVTAMPENLAVITGDAKAVTNGDANANAKWTCTGFEDRTTTKYPLCPQGSDVMRILDFPSCWDGENLDSEDHRAHIAFPQQDGSCQQGTVAVPQLRMTLTYERPNGTDFALDSFPDQQHNPITDHGDFMNMMPDALMAEAVDCINTGRACG